MEEENSFFHKFFFIFLLHMQEEHSSSNFLLSSPATGSRGAKRCLGRKALLNATEKSESAWLKGRVLDASGAGQVAAKSP